MRGKLLSHGLVSFLVLLGAVPAMMLPVLAGGVRGSEATMAGVGVLNALYLALTAALWMSVAFRKRGHAVLATLALVGALAFGAEIIGGSAFGQAAVPNLRLLSLAGWKTPASPYHPVFLGWLAGMQVLGWFFLRQAAATLAANWQDQPHLQERESEAPPPWQAGVPVASDQAAEATITRVSWLTDPRPWDANPVQWRVERLGSPQGIIWLAVAIDFLAQFGALGSIFYNSSTFADAWGLMSFVGMTIVFLTSGLLAWAGARFFQETRQQQDIELLLTTPVGRESILSAQWRVLRRALTVPVAVVLTLAVPVGISAGLNFASGFESEGWFLSAPALVAANLAVEAVTLCWVGMCFGLRARNLMSAVALTVGVVQFLPLALAVTGVWLWGWLGDRSLSITLSRGGLPSAAPVLFFFLIKNLGAGDLGALPTASGSGAGNREEAIGSLGTASGLASRLTASARLPRGRRSVEVGQTPPRLVTSTNVRAAGQPRLQTSFPRWVSPRNHWPPARQL